MKNLLFSTALLFAFCASPIFAQTDNDTYRNKVSLGFKGGTNFANIFDADSESFENDFRVGLAAGMFLQIPLGDLLGIHPEIMFSQKGFKGDGSLFGVDYEFSRTSNFIDVPLMVALKPSSRVTLLAGPQFSYLLSTTEDITADDLGVEIIEEFDNQDLRNNILGFAAGIDININQIVIGLRASWDLTNNSSDGSSEAIRYRNMIYQVTAGFRF